MAEMADRCWSNLCRFVDHISCLTNQSRRRGIAPSPFSGGQFPRALFLSLARMEEIMSDFSDEERRLISYFAGRKHDTCRRLSFYTAILIPLILFAAYGFFRHDIISIAIAFFGLLIYQFWHISGEIKYARLFHSIFTKLENGLTEYSRRP
jgi:hypothetical protein